MAAQRIPRPPPRAERPHMPSYGLAAGRKGLRSWSWAERKLRGSRNYWVVTVRPNGAPHAMPVWGVWLEGAFYFSTAKASVKARNLLRNRRCVVTTEHAEDAVVIEGTARVTRDAATLKRVAAPYARKYAWKLDLALGPVFAVTPQVAFALTEKAFTSSTTRWRF